MNDSLFLHMVFDTLAWIAAALTLRVVSRRFALNLPVAPAQRLSYYAVLLFGSGVGAYVFGTLNLWASGRMGLARSVEGALAGGIVAVELFKKLHGLKSRTGARLAAPLAIGVAVGRIGCFFGGLEDFTYGTATRLPWGYDFGDGVTRHPVQLYESLAMATFLVAYLAMMARNNRFVARNGFYLAVGCYGAQRFVWEFLKPYGAILGPFSVFHFLSAALALYAVVMIWTDSGDSNERGDVT